MEEKIQEKETGLEKKEKVEKIRKDWENEVRYEQNLNSHQSNGFESKCCPVWGLEWKIDP